MGMARRCACKYILILPIDIKEYFQYIYPLELNRTKTDRNETRREGAMQRAGKVVIVGGGNTNAWTPNIVKDMLLGAGNPLQPGGGATGFARSGLFPSQYDAGS